MATKKKTAEMVIEPENNIEEMQATKEEELERALEAERKKREELLKEVESLKAEAVEYRANDIDMVNTHDSDYWEEKIYYNVPFYGEPEDVSVKVNGERYLVQRGERVFIPRKVAAIFENQEAQRRYSSKMNRELQDKFEQQTKQFLG